MVCCPIFAGPTNPPAPAGPPVGPGLPLDSNLYLLFLLGVIFSFIFFRNYIKSGNKV